MKKFIFVIMGIIILYFAIAGILTLTKVCPEYINKMPQVVGPGNPGKNNPAWYAFCPFTKKVY